MKLNKVASVTFRIKSSLCCWYDRVWSTKDEPGNTSVELQARQIHTQTQSVHVACSCSEPEPPYPIYFHSVALNICNIQSQEELSSQA